MQTQSQAYCSEDTLTKDILTISDLWTLTDDLLAAVAGGKAHGLVRLLKAGGDRFRVPPFFVVRAGVNLSDEFSRQKLARQVDNALADIKTLSGAQTQNRSITFAVRSSCLAEDQKNGSFAGQFDSYLSVVAEDVFARIEAVIDSAKSINASQYKGLMHIANAPGEMAVLVQLMVEPQVAGVMFSRDPVNTGSQTQTVVISAVDGLADKLVQGLEDGEHITVSGEGIHRSGASHLRQSDIQKLAETAKQLEILCGYPVDVEWALKEQDIYILQLRPITTLPCAVVPNCVTEPTGTLRVFDGSNIQESYPGITTPMTFSFVRRAYKEVYRSFVRLMGVSDQVIGSNEDIFAGMLGFIDGHVYYNLGNWYRLLALLPAYKTNRQFMEKMMGLKEPALAVRPESESTLTPDLKAKIKTVFALANILGEYLHLEKSKADFYKRLDKALDLDRDNLRHLDADSLCRLYRSLEMDLLTKWDAPIVNDFFAMIFFGIFQKLNNDSSSYHTLIEGLGNVISAQPPRMIKEIAEGIKDDKALIAAMMENPRAPYVVKLFQSHCEAYALYQDYLAQFGDRSIGELKLESQSVRENPALLLATIGAVAGVAAQSPKTQLALAEKIGGLNSPGYGPWQADAKIKSSASSLPGQAKSIVAAGQKQPNLLMRLILPFVSNQTRHLIAGRENLRFARTRVFGLVRDIMLSLADIFVAQNVIDNRQDIFYLEIEEVLGFVEGSSTCKNLRALIVLRKAEEKGYEKVIPDRVPCKGPVGLLSLAHACGDAGDCAGKGPDEQGADETNTALQIKGLPACSGIKRGLARVIRDPAGEHLLPGEILVAERTDPGWIMHFALCQGIVTSYGSMLSHTAIVARELKIPAVVAAKGATEKIETGDLIEVDGTAGLVTIIRKAPPQVSFAPLARECA